jgi:hypothetical protein
MKCRICGYTTRTLNSMRKHYLREHPSAMKRHKKTRTYSVKEYQKGGTGFHYCPVCGKPLDNPCKR